MNESKEVISRRQMLKGGAALSAAGVLFPHRVFPNSVPLPVAGGKVVTPPSETVNVAGIGVGSMGSIDVRVANRAGARIVALCDVDEARAARLHKDFPGAARYKDFRRLLENEKGQVQSHRHRTYW